MGKTQEKHEHLVLLVDDSSNFREILSIELKAYGFRVIQAENGKEALEKMNEIIPEAVVLDVQMPVMDGVQTFLEMKSNPKLSDVRVIFLTSYGEPTGEFKLIDKDFAQKMGAFNYLNKQDDMSKIVDEVEKALHQEVKDGSK